MTAREAYLELEQLTPARAMAVYLMDVAKDEAAFQKGRDLFLLAEEGIDTCLKVLDAERERVPA